MVPPTLLHRVQQWLAARLGSRYAGVIDIADRGLTAFLIAFGGQLVAADVFSVGGLLDVSLWQKAGVAGLAALLSVLKSSVMTAITGHPALASLTSRTLRARRDLGHRVEHRVPVTKPKAVRT